MPDFFDGENIDKVNDILFDEKDNIDPTLDEQIKVLEEEILSEVEKSELVDSFLSSPIPVFDLKIPSSLESKFFYNLFVEDEYTTESEYIDKNGDKIYGQDPRVVLISWNPWASGLKDEQLNKQEILNFLDNNNFNFDILEHFLRMKLSSYHIKQIVDSNFLDHIDKNNYSISINLKHFSELSLQNRENYLSYVDMSDNMQEAIYDSTTVERMGHQFFNWKDYLFESILNLDESDVFEMGSDLYETDSTIGVDQNQNIDFDYVGFYIRKERIEDDGIKKDYDPIIVLGTNISSFKDNKVMYGKRYRYKIASLGRFVFQSIDENGDPVLGRIFVRSAFKFTDIIECKGSPFIKPPIDIRLSYKRMNKKLFVHWHPPRDIARKTAGYILYVRNSIKEPYKVLRIFDFTPEGYDREQFSDINMNFGSKVLVRSPRNEIFSSEFDVNLRREFYLAMSCFGVHNEISNYSEQFFIRVDPVVGLVVKRISRSGAPLGMPNMYIDKILEQEHPIYYRHGKDIVSSGFDKFSFVFNPEARYYTISSDNGIALHNIFETTSAKKFKDIARYDDNKRYYHVNVTDLELNKAKSLLVAINNKES